MIFNENSLLADNSHNISYLLRKMLQNLSSAAVLIGALKVKNFSWCLYLFKKLEHFTVVT